MIKSIPRELPYQILFALCVSVPYLGIYELTFPLWLFTILITIKSTYAKNFVNYTLCYVGIILVAAISTDYKNVNWYFLIRDVTYLLKPVLGLIVGYQMCRHFKINVFKLMVYVGFGIAIIHLSVLFHAFIFKGARSVNDLRLAGGYFSDFEVYAVVFAIFHRELEINFKRWHFWLFTAVIGFSAFMYLARTNFIQFILLAMAMKGFFIINRRAVVAITSVVIIAVVSYSVVLYLNPKRNGEGFEAMLYKIKVAPIEPFKTKINSDDYVDYNDNYRSVEKNLTLKQVKVAGPKAIMIGKGLGAQVDLKRKVFLGDMNLRFISVLHNSFMTAYLKAGLVGIFLILLSVWLLFWQPQSQIYAVHQANMLLRGSAIYLIVANYVLMGYFFTHDTKSVVVGILLAYRQMHLKKNSGPIVSE